MTKPLQSPTSPIERHFAELSSILDVTERRVLDVGCGQGAFLMRLQEAGAEAFGIEVEEQTLNAARSAGIPRPRLKLGDGRTLPYAEGSLDCVCFIFSFHHVPGDAQPGILAEVARVLTPNGHLFVVEPEPRGAMSEVIKPIEDETEVRTRSQSLLEAHDGPLRLQRETAYPIIREFADVTKLIEMVTSVDPSRAARAADPEIADEVARRFERHAVPSGARGFTLEQPCRAFHFHRAGD